MRVSSLLIGLEYTFWFVLILTTVVFIHELGHYLLARLNGVHVEVFSIGFGKEICGFNDYKGTRWKLSMIPLGGYVKMCGDSDPTSTPDLLKLKNLSALDRQQALHYKSLWRKATIVFAGPAFNFISAMAIIATMFYMFGKPVSSLVIGTVLEASAAQEGGVIPGDKIIKVNGSKIDDFESIRQNVALNVGTPINLLIERGAQQIELSITPKLQTTKDVYGNKIEVPILGITSNEMIIKRFTVMQSLGESVHEIYNISTGMLRALGQIATGKRSIKQLGGPVKIAQYSGQSAKYGLYSVMCFIALISINLGLVNLLPIPMLDGGHLMYYAVEAITGKPVAEKFQMLATKISFTVLVGFMVIVTYNDILNLITSK